MSRCFGEAAAVLSGLAARSLGWRPDEFWNSTPDELAAALELSSAGVPAGIDRASLARIFGDILKDPQHD